MNWKMIGDQALRLVPKRQQFAPPMPETLARFGYVT
jgi:hypothetical protein